MKLLVVEPHPDDAFLSLGWHLEKVWPKTGVITGVTILTVYHDDRRGKEGKAYADKVGAEWIGLGLDESAMLSSRQGTRKVDHLLSWMDDNRETFDVSVFPVGLQHPDHMRVAATRERTSLRYLDTPYAQKRKLEEELIERTEGLPVLSIAFPPKTKWRHKGIFKSQSKFFFYNSNLEEYRAPEIVFGKFPDHSAH